MTKISAPLLRRALIVCALGYFIDVFDIQVFTALRVISLTDLGVTSDKLPTIGSYILNAQMLGMVGGAFLWGWLGDRFGRLKALYGSILIYSIGTMACGFVHDPLAYGMCRLIAGFGLAGEQGGATTIIAEMMPPSKRGWGFATIGGIGFLGPIFASVIALFLPWRTTYMVGGLLGLVLFAVRVKLREPYLFTKMDQTARKRGSVRILLQHKAAWIFILCLAIGMAPIFHAFLLSFFSTEFSKAMLVAGENFDPRICLLVYFVGSSCGCLLSGALSQFRASRKFALRAFQLVGLATVAGFLLLGPVIKMHVLTLYLIYVLLGITGGGQVIITMFIAEHFGTNIRATASILLFNLMRGLTIPMLLLFQWLHEALTIAHAAALIGFSLYALSFLALRRLPETYARDLDYVEAR